jgi:hypothetical protein
MGWESRSCRPVYIPSLGLRGLGLGLGVHHRRWCSGWLEAGYAAVWHAVEGIAVVIALALFLVMLNAVVSFLRCSLRPCRWWKRLLPLLLLLQREASWIGGHSGVSSSIFAGPSSVCEVAMRSFCLLCVGDGGRNDEVSLQFVSLLFCERVGLLFIPGGCVCLCCCWWQQ